MHPTPIGNSVPRPAIASLATALTLSCAVVLLGAAGCSSPFFRKSKPDEKRSIDDLIDTPKLIGDVAIPFGLQPMKVEAIAVVNGLDGTGSDPPPSPQRDRLLGEIQTHAIEKPSGFLASPNTSMVYLRAFLPAGTQKGDRFDVEVTLPERSETSSIRNGWLMPSRVREMQVLGNNLHSGVEAGLASGPVVVDAVFADEESGVYSRRGRVLGGGVARVTRPLGLIVSSEHSSVQTSVLIGAAINARFHRYDGGLKRGVANPKEDDFIELALHPRYKHNMPRYIAVIRAIAFREKPRQQLERMDALKLELAEPVSASRAALHLEAIGRIAIPILKEGTRSIDPDIRFYAAEALAYLDGAESEAAETLAAAAKNDTKFRRRAFLALAAMDHLAAYDSLIALLDSPSVEIRYGAFTALRLRNQDDPLVRGEPLNNFLVLHRVPSSADPLIHFTRSKRPEVLIMGMEMPIRPPAFLYAGKEILIKATADGRLRLTRYVPGQKDRVEVCAADAEAMVRAIARLGGNYGDVLDAVRGAQASGDLPARVAIDTRSGGKRAKRDSEETTSADAADPLEPDDDSLPDDEPAAESEPRKRTNGSEPDVDLENSKPKRRFWSRMWRPFGD